MSEIRTDSLVNQSGDNDSGIDLSTNDVVAIKTANSEALRVDSSGTVYFKDGGSSNPGIRFLNDTDLGIFRPSANTIAFTNGGSESARIDSGGNVLTAKTSSATNTVGHEIRANGVAYHTRDAGLCLLVNRKTSDGAIIQVRKDDGVVGSIGSNGGEIWMADNTYGGFGFSTHATNKITPCDASGANKDNVLDLGHSNSRWNDAFVTNGVTTGSDMTEKQQIAVLSDAEMTAAKAISQLFKTYKWNSAVEAKGDDARIHTGVMAQEVAQALTDAGLDAGRYAFYMSDTWWEADGETYYNADDAPEGATEYNRKGIRYPELLSFVGAATEQRLANIETRLAALENA
jgi:hypothetical protein